MPILPLQHLCQNQHLSSAAGHCSTPLSISSFIRPKGSSAVSQTISTIPHYSASNLQERMFREDDVPSFECDYDTLADPGPAEGCDAKSWIIRSCRHFLAVQQPRSLPTLEHTCLSQVIKKVVIESDIDPLLGYIARVMICCLCGKHKYAERLINWNLGGQKEPLAATKSV